MSRSFARLAVILLMVLPFTSIAHGYQVLVSLNTYKKSTVKNAVARVGELKCNGVWLITHNCDFSDSEWKVILNKLGGVQITEDNPNQNQSYRDYVRITGKHPDYSFCYNETHLRAGGTQLTNAQIDTQSASHGDTPLICLTRRYSGNWKTQTDRCLANPKVGGMCIEAGRTLYVGYHVARDIPNAIKATLAHGKPVVLLLHAGNGWSLADNRKAISNLNRACPNAMKRKDVYLVYQNYNGHTDAWFGKNGVSAAIHQACRMPNYSGRRNK